MIPVTKQPLVNLAQEGFTNELRTTYISKKLARGNCMSALIKPKTIF